MKYLFLAYADENGWDPLTKADRNAFETACVTNDALLRETGQFIASASLHSGDAIAVCVHNGKLSLTDGPFAATNEQLTAVFFINARDLNEAIQVAAKMPLARGGVIEVRRIVEVGGSPGIRFRRSPTGPGEDLVELL